MKAVMLSIQPKWTELIASGKKTVEVRRTKPKIDVPFKCYIYETQGRTETPFVDEEGHHIFKGRGKVIGEFVCKNIDYWHISHLVFEHDAKIALKGTCLTKEEVEKYIGYEWGKNIWEKPYEFFGWEISDLVIYDKPKELSEFAKPDKCPYNNKGECTYAYYCYRAGQTKRCGDYMERPPQSWLYCEELKGETE